MVATLPSPSAQVRARLDHPVIDSDGHTVELVPLFIDYLRSVGGSDMVDRFNRTGNAWDPYNWRWDQLTEEERKDRWALKSSWWSFPTKNTLDYATARLPRLLYDRMEDLGIDYAILYPTLGLVFPGLPDAEVRQATCRAVNMFHADYYREYASRMTVSAVIPMHTPQEAMEELEYSVNQLGFKAVMLGGHVRRPIPLIQREHPDITLLADRIDVYAMDSEYDYDPVWAKCLELNVTPTSHEGGQSLGTRRSISNDMYNHIGHFASAHEALCKALLMGGVTRRFPSLRFGFLEGGVGWACSLLADLIGHWQKRGSRGIRNMDPANLDHPMLMQLVEQYGDELANERLEAIRQSFHEPSHSPSVLDEWASAGIEQVRDFYDLFVPRFFFGCEADDPMNALAFNSKVNPFGARLNAILSSDIGHWDVPDMRQVVAEAYESVEGGVITEEDFRDFVFTNPVNLYAGLNSDFFKGTVVEDQVKKLLTEFGDGGGP